MTRIKQFSLLLFFCICLLNISAQTSRQFTPKSLAQIQDTILKIMVTEHQSSIMLAIVTKDTVLISGGFGLANIETNQKANSRTLFEMASITKTFTALAIMKLVKQGKLSLYDDLSKIAPEIEYTNQWEKTNPIKIIHLLEHTTGFDDLRFNTFWNDDMNISELQAIVKCKNSLHCRWRPGERVAYSNIGYLILGYLIEKLSGKKYEDYLKKEILLPIGMTHSSFTTPGKTNTAYAYPYSWDGDQYIKLPHLQFYGKGAGALYSCADDMTKFLQFMINNGDRDSLSALHAIVDQMETPESSTPAFLGLKTGYGKGITIDYLTYKYPFYVHGGTSIGFFSKYVYNRDLQAGFVICGANPNAIADLLIHYFTDSLPSPKPKPTIPVNVETLKSYEGYYQLKSPRFEILNTYLEELFHGYHISVKNDSLQTYGFKRPYQVLLPVTNTIFKRGNESAPAFLFTTNAKGNKVLYEWGAYYEKTSYTKIVVIQILVLGGFLCGVLLLLSTIFWLIKTLFKKMMWSEYFKRSISAFGVLSLLAAFGALGFMVTDVSLMGKINFWTVAFYAGTWLFAILSLAGFIITVKRARQISNTWTKWYLLISTTWLIPLVVFFMYYGWIGLKMWCY